MAHGRGRILRSGPLHHVVVWQAAIFFLLICLVWANEILDLPNLFYGAEARPPDYFGASLLTAAVIVVGFINIAYSYLQHRRMLEGLFKVCSYCGKVEVDKEQWEKLDLFVAGRTRARFTHGVCPDCYRKLMEKSRAPASPPGGPE